MRFDEVPIYSQNAYSENEHLSGVIRFAIRPTSEPPNTGYQSFECSIKQPHGENRSLETPGTIEVILPPILRGKVNHAEFRDAAERYYYLMIGSRASGLRIEHSEGIVLDNVTVGVDYQCALVHSVARPTAW